MKVVSVINYKGGVGKTTVTANIAGELAMRGKNVLMIDLDPQASLTFSFVAPEYWDTNLKNDSTIKNWFRPSGRKSDLKFEDLIFSPEAAFDYCSGKLDLISSHLDLINVDLELATKLGGASLLQTKENFLKVHKVLMEGIYELEEDAYDVVLIDCPPNFNIVTKNALVASNYILIPAKPDYLSTLGIDYLKESVRKLIKEFNEYLSAVEGDDDGTEPIKPEIIGILFTMVQYWGEQPIQAIRTYINQAKKGELHVFENYIREVKSIFAEAPLTGLPVVMQDLGSAKEHIQNEIAAFVDEFLLKIV